MHRSEIISLAWIVFFAGFAALTYWRADRERNSALIERMGAFIFSAIALTTAVGAMAPQFIASALGVYWLSDSAINIAVMIASMIAAWVVFSRGAEWLAGLMLFGLAVGGTAMLLH
jgi:hypothetical protein